MRLPQLQELAQQMGISGVSKMRKSDLLSAIRAERSDSAKGSSASRKKQPAKSKAREAAEPTVSNSTNAAPAAAKQDTSHDAEQASAKDSAAPESTPEKAQSKSENSGRERHQRRRSERSNSKRDSNDKRDHNESRQDRSDDTRNKSDNRRDQESNQSDAKTNGEKSDSRQERGNQDGNRGDRDRNRNRNRNNDDENGRRRRSRHRDRKRRGRGSFDSHEDEPQVNPDDVLIPVAGILDVLDNYAFVRTSGYLPGPNDVYVSLGQVKRHGLRKGDAITGAVKQPQEGGNQNQRQKFNALVRLDTVNGQTIDQATKRVEFNKLTPLYPQERLKLETEPHLFTTRIIDLVSPIGKGQRGLIVSPPKAGKTLILQAIANAITTNNPECHLMVVLVDERPEEVTDMQRTVKGEVIASTFDRPAEDHTTVAELAIERAKRLVEMGLDVVVLLDSITRLGRAYNLAAPASGRILSGGVDSSALYPPKRFFGAARNIENGGSLTILATALVETGSKMDEVIFEEFKGTGNMELRLDRRLADKRLFPAVDVNPSGTRREEILLGREELGVMWKLRRVLTALDSQQSLELLISKLKDTKSNTEFLMQIQKTAPNAADIPDE